MAREESCRPICLSCAAARACPAPSPIISPEEVPSEAVEVEGVGRLAVSSVESWRGLACVRAHPPLKTGESSSFMLLALRQAGRNLEKEGGTRSLQERGARMNTTRRGRE